MSGAEPESRGVKVPRGRSPSFPAISLPAAVDRARTMWDNWKQHPVPIATITQKWGYKSPTTGPAATTYAALKKYGLVVEEGSGSHRRAGLSKVAVEILNKPDPSEALRQVALAPAIFRELWDRFGTNLPPAASLHYEFVIERGFTEQGFQTLLRTYQETVGHAGLRATDRVSEQETDTEPEDGGAATDVGRPKDQERSRGDDSQHGRRPDMLTYPFPIAGTDDQIVLQFPRNVPPRSWDQLMTLLEALKPTLVVDDDQH